MKRRFFKDVILEYARLEAIDAKILVELYYVSTKDKYPPYWITFIVYRCAFVKNVISGLLLMVTQRKKIKDLFGKFEE